MSVPPDQMAPQGQAPPPGGPVPAGPAPAQPGAKRDEALAQMRNLPPEIQIVVKESFELIERNGQDIVQRTMQSAGTLAIGLSQAAFAIISGVASRLERDAEEETGESVNIDLNRLVGDAGPAELVLARLFGVAEQMGIAEATDSSEYTTAGDALDVLLELADQGAAGDGREDPAAQGALAEQGPGSGWRRKA